MIEECNYEIEISYYDHEIYLFCEAVTPFIGAFNQQFAPKIWYIFLNDNFTQVISKLELKSPVDFNNANTGQNYF